MASKRLENLFCFSLLFLCLYLLEPDRIEETGLGQGEGAKDVSDQIENEDMLDGAYQNPEDGQYKEEKENKEEDNGIEMSENFESNLQDKNEEEKGDEDEEGKEGDGLETRRDDR